MDSIPAELLTSVLEFFMPPIIPSDLQSSYWNRAQHLHILSLPCRRWRDVVNNTPNLWTFIMVNYQTTCRRTEVYLKRAGSRPLDVHIYLFEADMDTEDFVASMSALKAKGGQWRRLWFYAAMGNIVLKKSMERSFPKALPGLEEATLSAVPVYDGFEPVTSTPNLLKLSVGNRREARGSPFPLAFFDTARLRHFSITERTGVESKPWYDLMMGLASFPCLESLELRSAPGYSWHAGIEAGWLNWPELPNLKTLILDGCMSTTNTTVITYIKAPLEEICLRNLATSGETDPLKGLVFLPCKVTFSGTRLSLVQAFAKDVMNESWGRESTVLRVDVEDVLKVSMRPFDEETMLRSNLPEATEEDHWRILDNWNYLVNSTRIEWVMPSGTVVSGADPLPLCFLKLHSIAYYQRLHAFMNPGIGKTTKISNEEVVAMAKSVTRMLPEDDDFYDLYLG